MANRNRSARIITKSKLYNRLDRERAFEVRTTRSTQAGVRIESRGQKKLVNVELILPSTTSDGEERTVRLNMTGRQARALYETLSNHYEREAENATNNRR